MLLVNGNSALNVRNFLFREQLTSRKAPQQHTAINVSFHSSIAKLENGTEAMSKYEQQVTESQSASCKNTNTYLATLIILNAILIFSGFILVSCEVFIIFKRRLNKKREKAIIFYYMSSENCTRIQNTLRSRASN